MSATHGMNVEEVRRLASDLLALGDRIETLTRSANDRVRSVPWSGRDADRFVHDWWPRHRAELVAAAAELRAFGDAARANADEQERTSATPTGGTADSVHPVGGDPIHLGWRITQDLPVVGTVIGIGKIAWNGALFSKANLDEAVARVRYGGDDPVTRHAEAVTMGRSQDTLREIVDTGVGLTPIGVYRDGLDATDALGDYLFGTGDHSDALSPGEWLTGWVDG